MEFSTLCWASCRATPRGCTGTHLKRQCERFLGSFWQLNFGEIYRVLDKLADEGQIEQMAGESSRKVYRITERGRQNLDDFILTPPTDAPRPLRQELAVKLLFASAEQMTDVVRMIDHQREAYMTQLHQLGAQRRKIRCLPMDSFVTGLLIDGAELQVRAELTWLDDVTSKLQERFGAESSA